MSYLTFKMTTKHGILSMPARIFALVYFIKRKETKMNTKENVTELLKDLSGVSTITPEASLSVDLGFDSLAMVTLLVMLEETFSIELMEADMNPFHLKNAADVVALAERYVDGHGNTN